MSVWKIALGVLLGLVMAYLLWALVAHVHGFARGFAREPASEPSERARKQAALTQIDNFKTALGTFEVDCSRFPTTDEGLKALVEQPASAKGWQKAYIESIPNDPWGNPYMYRCPGTHRPDFYDVYSTGTDGNDSGGENINNWTQK